VDDYLDLAEIPIALVERLNRQVTVRDEGDGVGTIQAAVLLVEGATPSGVNHQESLIQMALGVATPLEGLCNQGAEELHIT
jgi:hypothetical protein